MIEVPTWVVAAAVVGVVWLLRRSMGFARIEGFRLALCTIVAVAEKYKDGNDSPLAPHEQDVAGALTVALPDLIDGYAKSQARAVDAGR